MNLEAGAPNANPGAVAGAPQASMIAETAKKSPQGATETDGQAQEDAS